MEIGHVGQIKQLELRLRKVWCGHDGADLPQHAATALQGLVANFQFGAQGTGDLIRRLIGTWPQCGTQNHAWTA